MEYSLSAVLGEMNIARRDAELLLCATLRIVRTQLIAHPELAITAKQRDDFLFLCQRRARGEPIAYLLGVREFYGLSFFVNQRVLIPRPETELLVEIVRKLLPSDSGVTVWDIGTGSGCIAIALSKNLPHISLCASDISLPALDVASRNCEFHGVSERIELRVSDLLKAYSRQSCHGIVANLPYIGTIEHHLVEKDVMAYEPHTALFGGNTGLELYARLFEQLHLLKQMPNWIVGEIGFLQRPAFESLVGEILPQARIEFYKDLAGFDRGFAVTI